MEDIKKIFFSIRSNEKYMKIFRYLIAGGLTTLVSFSTFWLFKYILGIETNLANIMSIACAVLFAYVVNKIHVFKSKSESFGELVLEAFSFVFSRGVTILLEIGGVFLLATVLKLNEMLSKALISIIVIILNYIFSKLFVFKEKQ